MYDLMDTRHASGLTAVYQVSKVNISDLDSPTSKARYFKAGHQHEMACNFIVGCDGFYGVCRDSVPKISIQEFEHVYSLG